MCLHVYHWTYMWYVHLPTKNNISKLKYTQIDDQCSMYFSLSHIQFLNVSIPSTIYHMASIAIFRWTVKSIILSSFVSSSSYKNRTEFVFFWLNFTIFNFHFYKLNWIEDEYGWASHMLHESHQSLVGLELYPMIILRLLLLLLIFHFVLWIEMQTILAFEWEIEKEYIIDYTVCTVWRLLSPVDSFWIIIIFFWTQWTYHHCVPAGYIRARTAKIYNLN